MTGSAADIIDQHPQTKSPLSSGATGIKVLVADDSPVYRKLVEQALSPESCQVLFAKSGHEALEIFARERPSLVVTDWLMPDLSGIELCQKIRASGETPYTYVIILTTIAEKDKVVKGLSAGADDYLTKPFHREDFLARVHVGQRLLDLHRQIEEKNRLLEELALSDPLTGLPNRRAIDSWAAHQLSGAARHGFSVWVTVIDLDHFKHVNDAYGHDAGDAVLRRFAEILRAHTRLSDISGRIGGEEFLQILTHTTAADIRVVLERIRQQLASERFWFSGSAVNVTASFGSAGFGGQGKNPPGLNELMTQADAALYRAKHLGRNRIEIDQAR
jgi:two-component system cell cycle response regulator